MVFSYEACPVHEDGRRRAVTRDGREAVLLCDDAPGDRPIIGWTSDGYTHEWSSDGRTGGLAEYLSDLFVPPKPKRVVWVNLYDPRDGFDVTEASHHDTQAAADAVAGTSRRLGDRAYPIEIDP